VEADEGGSAVAAAGGKRNRRIATRYEKLAVTFLGFVYLAAIIDWINFEV
jgi:transposase